jgi:TolB-like protein
VGEIFAWIGDNEAVLSGIAAALAIVGVVSAVIIRTFDLFKPRSRAAEAPIEGPESAALAGEPVLTEPRSARPSIAVLPFLNLSDERDKDYFADGLTEDILTRLSLSRHLSVKSRSSTFGYKGQSPDIRQVGKDLDVAYVVEGSVRPVGDRVRITVQLIEAASGDNLWAQNYDRAATELFDVQDEVIASITSALGAVVSKAESSRAAAVQPNSLSAWEAVQRASFYRGALGNSEEETNQSIEELRKAAADEPDYAYAHSMLAWILQYRAINGLTDDQQADMAEAQPHLDKGLSLAPDDPFNLNICSGVMGYRGEWQRSIDLCKRGLANAPHFADLYFNLGLAYAYLDRFEEAEEALDRVEQMAPGGPMSRYYDWYRSLARIRQGRYEEAEPLLRSTIEKAPGYTSPYVQLALVEHALGREAEARATLGRCLAINPRLTPDRLQIHVVSSSGVAGAAWFEGLQTIWPAGNSAPAG